MLRQFRLDPAGIHGVPHWARVCENGRVLAAHTGADVEVVDLFALLHDACRGDEGTDAGHGARAAVLAARLRGEAFELDDARFALLVEASAKHERGLTEGDPTVTTCWDADRLDLGRVGIVPRGDRLCTAQARELSRWSFRRGAENVQSAVLTREWGWSAEVRVGSR